MGLPVDDDDDDGLFGDLFAGDLIGSVVSYEAPV